MPLAVTKLERKILFIIVVLIFIGLIGQLLL